MNLCLNAFVIQFPDGLLDTCSVSAPRALLLPYAHRGHCKDEDSYKECSSHVELSIGLTSIRRKCVVLKANIFRLFLEDELPPVVTRSRPCNTGGGATTAMLSKAGSGGKEIRRRRTLCVISPREKQGAA